jgi:heme oxygenase
MSRLTKLHQNPNHKIAENSPFILRMRFKKDENPSRVDSINTAKQLRHIYQALETKLANYEDQERFDIFRKAPWQKRSQCLTQDINQMSKQLHITESNLVIDDDQIFDATQAMIDDIEQGDEYTLLGYLAVRCLGDVFGGQHLNDYNQRTFGKQKLDGFFYSGVSGQMRTMSKYINTFKLSDKREEQFFNAAERCFEHHVDLFKQMEEARMPIRNYALGPEGVFSFKQDVCYTLFGVAAIVATGVIYMSAQTCDSVSPNL